MHRSPWAALAVAALLAAATPGRAALDLPQLRAHAAGRQLALSGDVAGAQAAWDAILASSGPVTALVVTQTCGDEELRAALEARRALSPLWIVGGSEGGCRILAWGAFADEDEARRQAEMLAPGMLPVPLQVVTLTRPLDRVTLGSAPPPQAPRQVPAAEVPPPARPAEPVRQEPRPEPVVPAPKPPAEEPAPRPVPPPVREPVRPVEAPPAAPVRAPEPEPVRPAVPEPPPAEPAPAEQPAHVPASPAPGENAAMLFAQGNAAYARGDYDGAITNFEKALALEPSNPRSWNNLGTTWLLKRDPVRAEEAFRKSIELDGSYGRAHLNLGSALYGQNKPIEARREFETATRLDPHNADTHYNLAALLVDMGLLSDASEALRRGLEQNPGNPVLEGYLQDVEKQAKAQGEPLAETPVAPPAGAPAPSAPSARTPSSRPRGGPCADNLSRQQRAFLAGRYFSEGKSAYDRGEWAGAQRAFEDALSCDPTSVPILNHLGAARLRAGDTDGAGAALDLATTLDPRSIDAGVNLALTHYSAGRCDDAIAQLRDLDRVHPGTSEVKFQEGRLLYKCGQVTEAMAALEEAKRRDPSDSRAGRLLDELSNRQVAAP